MGITGRDNTRLQQVCESIGSGCRTYVVDVRDAEAMRLAAKDFIAAFGVPDVVIANAGVSRGTLTEYSEDLPAFRAVMDINVLGLAHTFHPFIQAMKEQGGGSLAGIASVAGLRGLPGAGAYSASKAAAIAYLEALRVELAGAGISVTTICPGYIRTPMTDVNPYPMPFLMDADVAARKMAGFIARRRRYVILPWQMALLGRLMKLIPAPLWDWAMRKAPHKPRMKWDWL